jgi:chromosome partitioning protein
MAKTIVFSVQKGGSGKTTTSGVVSYLLSRSYRVLSCDLDSQGNLTEMLTGRDIYDFHGRTILEAMQEQNAKPYIHRVMDNLDILTADDLLATFSRWLYSEYRGNRSLVLRETLRNVQDEYDFIIIDTPPALSDQTINALAASDAVVVMFEPSKFCYSAIGRFLETVAHVQEKVHPGLKVAGILTTIIDKRRTDSKALLELLAEEYEDLVFDTVITRKASTGRLSIEGFVDNPELADALEQYIPFLEELLKRVGFEGQAQRSHQAFIST